VGENINDYFTLEGCISDVVQDEFLKRKYTDSQESGKVVTAVSQNNGTISVTKKTLALSELSGTLGIAHGGTGIDQIDTNEILVYALLIVT
jgi:hypothetical protein